MNQLRLSESGRAARSSAAPVAPLRARGHSVRRTASVKVQAATPEAKIGAENAAAEIELITLGLDRGLNATAAQAKNVEACVYKLEAGAHPVKLSWVVAGQVQCGMDLLDGVWRLIYSSAFESGNLGGSRPGPPAELAPVRLGPIYQAIDCKQGILDNIVELEAPPGAPQLTAARLSLRVRLRHTFTTTDPDSVRIVYDSTSAEVLSDGEVAKAPGLGWPLRFEPPALQRLLPEEARSASFRVTVLTDTLRVTRGDRGELRVYVADHSALPAAGGADIPDPDTNTTFS